MMKVPLYKKALWIAEQMNDDADNVYDVLLYTIKKPEDFVNEVFTAAREYDEFMERYSD